MGSLQDLDLLPSLLLLLLLDLLLDQCPLVDLIGPLKLLDSPLGLIPVLVVNGLRRHGMLHALVHGARVQTMVLFGLVNFKE